MKKQISTENQKKLEAIGSFLSELRLNLNIMQQDLENDVHRNTLSRIENSKNFTVLTLLILCEIYEIAPSQLMAILD